MKWNNLELPDKNVYFQDDDVVIYCADCRDILPELPKVDLVLTGPPYGVDKASWDTEFTLPSDIKTNTLGLIPGVANIQSCGVHLLGLDYKWQLIAHLVNGMTHGAIGYGNYIACLVYSSGSIYNNSTDCKDFSIGTEQKPNHPSPKPERPIAWFIDTLSKPNNIILDPFLGSGTTAYCAKKLGRKCIGIEISSDYCQIAVERLRQSVMRLDV